MGVNRKRWLSADVGVHQKISVSLCLCKSLLRRTDTEDGPLHMGGQNMFQPPSTDEVLYAPR